MKNMKIVCPNSKSHKKFLVEATVVEEWVVDENSDLVWSKGQVDVDHYPGPNDKFTCVCCGSEAEVEKE